MDDDTGTRPESNGPEPDGTEARGARGTDARTADDSGAHKAHGSGAGRAHSTGDHESHDTPGHETHETHGTDNPQTHDTGARHTHGTPDRPPRDATRRQTPSTDDPRTRRTAHPRHAGPEPVDTAHRAARWEQRTEIPLAVASLAFLAAYALRVLAGGLPDAARDLFLTVMLAAWALFAVDYAVRWRLSGQRLRFVRTHVLDTLVLLLPLLRPLRVVKLYEAVQRRRGRPRLALHARVIVYAGLAALLLGFTGALAVYQQEHHAPDATMRTFGDAVWWTCATLATVGYGDVVPVTPLGRLIAVGVMAIGLALLGAVTGAFASWLLQVFAREDDEGPPGN